MTSLLLLLSKFMFVQQKLGAPSVSEYEKLQAEMSDLQLKYNELLAAHQENYREDRISRFFWLLLVTSVILHKKCNDILWSLLENFQLVEEIQTESAILEL
ncbi:hypothetical protein WN943_025707 [Citrus x changshan-huyou]